MGANTQKRHSPKKGLATEAVGLSVLFLVSLLILLIVFGTKIWPTIKPAGIHEMCKQSVQTYAGRPFEAFRGSIKCEVEHVKIEDDLATPKGQENTKARLAQAMYECWDDYGQGRLDLFTRQNVYCGVCSFIDFEDKKGKITGFTDYLGKTSVPNKEISYLDFLAGYESPRFRDYMENQALYDAKAAGEAVEIDSTSERWAVLLLYARGEPVTERIKDFLSPNVQGGGGKEIGAVSVGVIGGSAGAAAPFLLFGSGPIVWTTAALPAIVVGGMTIYTFNAFSDKPQTLAFVRLAPYSAESFKKLGCKELPIENA